MDIVLGKPPKLVNTTYFLVAKKCNQPPLSYNKLVELESSNTKNKFINTQFPTEKSIFTLVWANFALCSNCGQGRARPNIQSEGKRVSEDAQSRN